MLLLLSLFTLLGVSTALAKAAAVGQATEFPVPQGGLGTPLVRGSDGNLYFTTAFPGTIGHITPAGQIAEFSIPAFNSLAVGGVNITTGSDGNLWFTANARQTRTILFGLVVRVSTAGAITEFATPTAQSHPAVITSGSDGNLWFLESNVPAIGRINTH